MPLIGAPNHRCYDKDMMRMCEFFTTTSPPDCDYYCGLMQKTMSVWSSTLPSFCPILMTNGDNIKRLLDRTLKHWDKRPSAIITFRGKQVNENE